MSNKKTLVILTPGFPSSEEDTTCLPLQQSFIRKLNSLFPKLEVVILSFQYPYFTREYKWYNNTVFSYNGKNKGGISRLLLRRKINSSLKKIHANTEIVGILSFWLGECAYSGKRFADRNGLQHCCWIFGQDARKGNKYSYRVKPKDKELIALSDFLQDEFEKNYKIRPAHVIPLGGPSLPGTIMPEKDIDVFGAGSLIPLKQYDIFLEVVAGIKTKLPRLKVILAGDGPEKSRLQEIIARLGLQETVMLTGEIPYPVMMQLMQRAKVFLHPSSYEGFSGVCLEALHSGAHAISFCRAMKEDIDQWHIVQTKEEMMQRALSILQNTETPYAINSSFSMDDTVEKVMGVYGCHTST